MADYPRVTHPCAAPTTEYCYPVISARLACLIHAASVRSEPESNSPLKLGGRGDQHPTRPKFVAGAAKAPTDLTFIYPDQYDRSSKFLRGWTSKNPGFVRSKSLISKKIDR